MLPNFGEPLPVVARTLVTRLVVLFPKTVLQLFTKTVLFLSLVVLFFTKDFLQVQERLGDASLGNGEGNVGRKLPRREALRD